MSTQYDISVNNNEAVVRIIGKVDSGNAEEFEKTLFEGIQGAKSVILDLDQLEYVSSAGLRVFLKLKKRGAGVQIINASNEVYEIFTVTGFANLFDIKKKRRRLSAEGCEEIARGAMGIIYRLDPETILKVYDKSLPLNALYQSQETLKKLFINEIPCAIPFDIVDVDDTHGAVYEMLEADTLAQYIMKHPDEVEICAEKAARLLKEMHQKELPDNCLTPARTMLKEWLEDAKSFFTPDEIQKLDDMIDQFKDTNTFLHLDFHTKNLMIKDGELIIIDLDDACVGDPMIDIACIMMAMCNKDFNDEESMHFVGLTLALRNAYISKFFEIYFETTDLAKIDSILEKLKPIVGLRTIHAALNRVGMTEEARNARLAKMVAFTRSVLQ